jgi:hypothetical protein
MCARCAWRPFPEFSTPEFSLDSWRRGREEFPGAHPAPLLMVGYQSWSCMSIELDTPDTQGGALFEWYLVLEDFVLRHHTLTDWLARITELVLAGSFTRQQWQIGTVLRIEDPSDDRPAHERRAQRPHPFYGDATLLPGDPQRWPEHWQRASGIEPSDLVPHGATHTVAEVLASDAASERRATIVGDVVGLAGQRDTFVRVSDGTATIDVRCPARTTTFGPVIGERFEFDVVVPAGHRATPEESVMHAQNPHDPVERLTEQLSRKNPRRGAATATAVRRAPA